MKFWKVIKDLRGIYGGRILEMDVPSVFLIDGEDRVQKGCIGIGGYGSCLAAISILGDLAALIPRGQVRFQLRKGVQRTHGEQTDG